MTNEIVDKGRLDTAARAAWLYFIAGNTQEQVAQKMRISRPTAQRLISLALSEHLVTFRFKHQIDTCMEFAAILSERYGLKYCEVVPADPARPSALAGVAAAAALFIEQTLAATHPIVLAIGTGRTLRAAVELVQPMSCEHHTFVALVGNIAHDGSASAFDVISRLADLTKAHHYPISLPVLADDEDERKLLVSLRTVRRVHALSAQADVVLVGVGQMDMNAPQFLDGFISRDELLDQIRLGAVGEITGWNFNQKGQLLSRGINTRITSAPAERGPDQLVVGIAVGEPKAKAIQSALTGRLLNGLITDEETARLLINRTSEAI